MRGSPSSGVRKPPYLESDSDFSYPIISSDGSNDRWCHPKSIIDNPIRKGIYAMINSFDGKVYIGSSVNILDHWRRHMMNSRNGIHRISRIQKAYDEFGHDGFMFCILEECELDELSDRESFWINKFRSYEPNLGYNSRYRHSGETKSKRSHYAKQASTMEGDLGEVLEDGISQV